MSRHLQALVGLIDDLTPLKDVQTCLVCWLFKRSGKPLATKLPSWTSTGQKASSPLNLVLPTKLSCGRLRNSVT
jgi:hypothetical protein